MLPCDLCLDAYDVSTRPLPMWIDGCLRKHYLPPTSFAGSNEPKHFDLQTLAQLLYKAAEDGDVDPHEVSKILKVGRSEAEGATGAYGGGSAGRAGQSKCMQFSLKDFFSLFFFC